MLESEQAKHVARFGLGLEPEDYPEPEQQPGRDEMAEARQEVMDRVERAEAKVDENKLSKSHGDDPEIDWDALDDKAYEKAKALATKEYLDEYKKTVLAEEMAKAEAKGHSSCAAQEREARRSQEYKQVLEEWREAIMLHSVLADQMILLRSRIDIWRTRQSNRRAAMQAGG